jgi:putative glutamine transport system substrate-binding protein
MKFGPRKSRIGEDMVMLLSKDRLTAGTAFDLPGMGYQNPATGEMEGFEVEIAKAVAGELLGDSSKIEFLKVLPDNRLETLEENKADIVISQLTITPDRAERVDFSIPYYVGREAILVRKAGGITSYEDLKGKRVALAAGSISLRRMRVALTESTLIVTPEEAGGVQAVVKGEADAASNDDVNLHRMHKNLVHPEEFEVIDIGDHFDPKPFGIAVKKGNQKLVKALNTIIEKLDAGGQITKLENESMA